MQNLVYIPLRTFFSEIFTDEDDVGYFSLTEKGLLFFPFLSFRPNCCLPVSPALDRPHLCRTPPPHLCRTPPPQLRRTPRWHPPATATQRLSRREGSIPCSSRGVLKTSMPMMFTPNDVWGLSRTYSIITINHERARPGLPSGTSHKTAPEAAQHRQRRKARDSGVVFARPGSGRRYETARSA
jgi:hypothetical protein